MLDEWFLYRCLCLPTGPPMFESLLSDWTTKIGQTIKLTCKVSGSPKPVVSWLKGKNYLITMYTSCTYWPVVSQGVTKSSIDAFRLILFQGWVASYFSYIHWWCPPLRWPSFRGWPSSHHLSRPVRDLQSHPGQPHCTGLWTVCLLC